MGEGVEILRVDWERVRVGRPEATDEDLGAELYRRGEAVVSDREPYLHDGLRRDLVLRAALVAVHRFSYATSWERFKEAEAREEESYRRHAELAADVLPPLKAEARMLRARVRDIEAQAVGRGVDVESIEHQIDWRRTIAVDTPSGPGYETPAAQRARIREIFGRGELR
jgi:hypothetical protein